MQIGHQQIYKMTRENHEKLYDILLEIKEDLGEFRSEIGGINKRLDTLNGQVAKHASFINTWKGKFAIISSLVGGGAALLITYIKQELWN